MPKEKYPPLDRSAFSVVDLKDADDDLQYWLSRTPQERLAAIELNRRMVYGYDRAASRLQKFLEVVDLDECQLSDRPPRQ